MEHPEMRPVSIYKISNLRSPLLFFGGGLVAKLCPTLCDPMDCSPPGSSVHGIFHARILEWVAIFFSRGIFLTQGLKLGLLHCRQSPAQSKKCR